MKIYFSGSIRGGRDDVEYYAHIIKTLQKHGTVLTTHIGDTKLGIEGENLPETEIFKRDVNWIKEADYVVAEVSQPSIGVGWEIAFAESIKKRVLCLYRIGAAKKVSTMIEGNKNIDLAKYSTLQEAEEAIHKFFRKKPQKLVL